MICVAGKYKEFYLIGRFFPVQPSKCQLKHGVLQRCPDLQLIWPDMHAEWLNSELDLASHVQIIAL